MIIGKKGSGLDFLILLAIGLALVITILLTYYTSDEIFDAMSESAPSESTSDLLDETFTAIQTTYSVFDYAFLIFFFGILASTLILAYFSRNHPILFPIYILFMLVMTVIAVPISNVYYEIKTQAEFSPYVASIPMADFIMMRLPTFLFISMLIGALILYATIKSGSYGGGARGGYE